MRRQASISYFIKNSNHKSYWDILLQIWENICYPFNILSSHITLLMLWDMALNSAWALLLATTDCVLLCHGTMFPHSKVQYLVVDCWSIKHSTQSASVKNLHSAHIFLELESFSRILFEILNDSKYSSQVFSVGLFINFFADLIFSLVWAR